MDKNERILVTGAGGYLAMHCVNEFLKGGYRVRGTVRNLNDENKVKALRSLASGDNLEIVEADLLDKGSWEKAVKDVTILIHVASPFPMDVPSDENVLIKPALEGTLNVLNAAFNANVKRVVLTSSTISITGYHREDRLYTEEDWPEPDKQLAYGKSKILAERAAWNFVEEKKKAGLACFDLAVINPSFILGPTLHVGSVNSTSESRIIQFLDGTTQKIPCWNVGCCDVRDVALAHFRAAFSHEAVGHRHAIMSSPQFFSMKDVADILYEEFGPKGYPVAREVDTGSLSKTTIDNTRMIEVLKITPTPFRNTIIDMANSLIQAGLVKKP